MAPSEKVCATWLVLLACLGVMFIIYTLVVLSFFAPALPIIVVLMIITPVLADYFFKKPKQPIKKTYFCPLCDGYINKCSDAIKLKNYKDTYIHERCESLLEKTK